LWRRTITLTVANETTALPAPVACVTENESVAMWVTRRPSEHAGVLWFVLFAT